MPSRIRRVPSYRLHKPSGQARVIVSGEHIYLGKYGSSESLEEYHRLIAEWLAAAGQRPQRPNGRRIAVNISVSELILAYWTFAKGYYCKHGKPTGHIHGVKSTLRLVRELYGRTNAADFSPKALHAVQERMIASGQSRRYINDTCDRIKRLFKWAVSRELLPVDVHQALMTVSGLKKGRTAARETGPVRPVDDADVEAVLPALSSPVRAMVEFQRLTGCRPAEARFLRPCDIEMSDGVWCYVPAIHKAEHYDRERRVFVGPKAQELLKFWLERGSDEYCFSPREAVAGRKRHKTNANRSPGRRYTKDSYRQAIIRACKRVGVKQWTPNRLRHSRATEIRKKYGLEGAQIVLGHANADVTQIYAERDYETARRIMNEMG